MTGSNEADWVAGGLRPWLRTIRQNPRSFDQLIRDGAVPLPGESPNAMRGVRVVI